jgi:hypothetical protein
MAREDFFDLSFDELAEHIQRAYAKICEESDKCLGCQIPVRYEHSKTCQARRILGGEK